MTAAGEEHTLVIAQPRDTGLQSSGSRYSSGLVGHPFMSEAQIAEANQAEEVSSAGLTEVGRSSRFDVFGRFLGSSSVC